MNVLIDIILVSAFAYFVVKYFKAGLFLSVLGLGKPFASFLVAAAFGENLSKFVLRFMTEKVGESEICGMISSVISYAFLFIVSYIIISITVNLLSSVKIPVISQIDRSLGALFGVFIGLIVSSLISVGVYSALSACHEFIGNPCIMEIYNDSVVFKNVYNLRFLYLIKELT